MVVKCFIYVDLNMFRVNNARIYIPTHKLLGIVLVRLDVSQYIFKLEEITWLFLGEHYCLYCFKIYVTVPSQHIPNPIQTIYKFISAQWSMRWGKYTWLTASNFICHIPVGKIQNAQNPHILTNSILDLEQHCRLQSCILPLSRPRLL